MNPLGVSWPLLYIIWGQFWDQTAHCLPPLGAGLWVMVIPYHSTTGRLYTGFHANGIISGSPCGISIMSHWLQSTVELSNIQNMCRQRSCYGSLPRCHTCIPISSVDKNIALWLIGLVNWIELSNWALCNLQLRAFISWGDWSFLFTSTCE